MTVSIITTGTSFIYIRYAEVLLTFAEARNENLSAPDTEVYDAVNQIRQRQRRSSLLCPPACQRPNAQKLSVLERRLGICFRGMHLFDTRSYKTTEKDVTKPVYRINAKKEKAFLLKPANSMPTVTICGLSLEGGGPSSGCTNRIPGWD